VRFGAAPILNHKIATIQAIKDTTDTMALLRAPRGFFPPLP